jgi:hypothetical protein
MSAEDLALFNADEQRAIHRFEEAFDKEMFEDYGPATRPAKKKH